MISALSLRVIALVTMLIDHIGGTFGITEFLYIGRVSFLIFAFLIVNGFRHTHNLNKYLFRLAAFAVISEIPYNLIWSGDISYPNSQNVFVTLFLGLCCISLIDWLKNKHVLLCALPLVICCYAAFKLKCDYDFIGVLTVCAFYFFDIKNTKNRILLIFAMLFLASYDAVSFYAGQLFYDISGFDLRSVVYFRPFISERPNFIQIFRIFGLVPIFLYSGKKGWQPKSRFGKIAFQYAFYLFYPAHLLLLYGINFI